MVIFRNGEGGIGDPLTINISPRESVKLSAALVF